MATQSLAEWTCWLEPSSIPQSVLHAATRSFYNYVGCAIGGHSHPGTQMAIQASLSSFAADSPSTLLGAYENTPAGAVELPPSVQLRSEKADPLQAALVNGIAAHVHDFDDTHLSTIIHPTAPVASALLAYAEYCSRALSKPLTGLEFLCALVAGIEVECLLGLSVWPSHYDVGWHITASVGSIGAAVAVGKAMQLKVGQMQHAIGIASSQVAGMRQHFGSHSKPLGVGRAAQSGLQAALLAQRGMTAAENALEGKRGWVACVCPDQQEAMTKLKYLIMQLDVGQGLEGDGKWEVEKNTFKPFPCGIVIHPVIDGCARLRAGGEIDVSQIESVELLVHPLVLELTGKKTPRDGLEGKFSVYHGAACGLLFGKATPAQYEDEFVHQTEQLRKKIEAAVNSNLRADECRIAVTSGGKHHEIYVEHAVGSLAAPMTDQQLELKFMEQCSGLLGLAQATKLSHQLWNVQQADNVADAITIE